MDATPSDNGGGNSGTGTVTPPWYTINERQDLAHKHYYHAGDLFSITYTGTSLGDELALYASGINEGTGAEEFDNHAQDFAFVLLGTGTTQSSSGIFDITIPSLFPIGNYVLQFSRLVGGVESSKFFVPKTYDYVNDGGFNVVTGILPPGMSGGGGGSGT